MSKERRIEPIHPGEILLEEFMKPLKLTAYRIANDLNIPAPRIYDIIRRKRSITADTALRLAKYFGTTPGFWLNLQNRYDLDRERDRVGEEIDNEVKSLA